MDLSSNGAQFLRGQEGFVDHWYDDGTGVGTIGVGFTWRSTAFRAWWVTNRPGQKFGAGAKMSRAEADAVLIVLCRDEYGKSVNDFLRKDVPQHVFDGMVSPVYNCGAGTLADHWAGFAKAGDYAAAARALATTRVTAGGKRLAGLVRRRKEEGDLIRDGVYAGITAATRPSAPDPMADGVLMRRERGPAVAALIRDLASLGFYKGTFDDLFGYGTEAAVLEFQRANGLKADGIAGPKTLSMIAAKLAAKSTAATSAAPTAATPKAAEPTAATPPKADNDNQPNWLAALIGALLALFTRKAA